jgi:hypothetical protein
VLVFLAEDGPRLKRSGAGRGSLVPTDALAREAQGRVKNPCTQSESALVQEMKKSYWYSGLRGMSQTASLCRLNVSYFVLGRVRFAAGRYCCCCCCCAWIAASVCTYLSCNWVAVTRYAGLSPVSAAAVSPSPSGSAGASCVPRTFTVTVSSLPTFPLNTPRAGGTSA